MSQECHWYMCINNAHDNRSDSDYIHWCVSLLPECSVCGVLAGCPLAVLSLGVAAPERKDELLKPDEGTDLSVRPCLKLRFT